MHHLPALDVIIVVVYLLATTLLGVWFARRQTGLGSYLVGDRNVAWWLILASIIATETSTVTFLSVPGLAFHRDGGNLTFLQLSLGYIIGRVLVAWLLLPAYLRGEVLSAYQVLRQRFDVSVQRTASGLFLITRSVADGLRLYLTALLLQQFTGWNAVASVIVIGLVTIVYTYLGGMQAVVWTDLIQLVIYLLGAVAAGWCILSLIPGGWTDFVQTAQSADKFVWLDLSFQPRTAYTLWAGVIGGAFFSMASHGADQLMVQRYLCSRSLGQARVALVLSGVAVLFQFALFLLLGVGLYVLWAKGMMPIAPRTKDDEVFGQFIVDFLPSGLVGVVVAAVLAAAMSTLSSSLNSSSGAFVADFYRPLRPDGSDRHYLVVSRTMTAMFGLVQVAVALATVAIGDPGGVVNKVLTVAGFTTGLVLGLFILGLLPRPVSSVSALVGVVAGFGAVCLVWLPLWGGKEALAWPWYAPVGSLTTVAVALACERTLSPSSQ